MTAQETPAGVTRGMQSLLAQRDAAVARGDHPVGWKIGFNTAPIQQHFGLSEPVVGYLVDRAVQPDGATVSLEGWSAPAVEVEVAVRVGPPDESGAPTVVGLGPALELVDLGIPFDDIERVLADNICQRGVVFGEDISDIDPFAIAVSATKNGQPVGDGSLVEGPAVTAGFVRDFLRTHGAELEPGQRIIAGSLTPPITVAPGDALHVTFGPLGALSVNFS
jgi:2-oxo-hept-3-ene-1,7-dioate hydratase